MKISVGVAALVLSVGVSVASEQPNILWITSEDNGPYLGCYGDPVARTPSLDRLAAEGVRYTNCFSNAAVCAPARQTLITGMYASSLGGQHMRSKVAFPDEVAFFPKYLRGAGYHTSNSRKTDYNGAPAVGNEAGMAEAWDESGNSAHWRNREAGQPFFSVFNFTESHESNLFESRWKNRELITDPAAVELPAYLPDRPEIRRDLARYYDCIETMDRRVGGVLAQLEEDGLVDDTIVFYFSDHGGSLPRGKSFIYDSGTRVPLIVRIPEKWKQLRPGEVDWEEGAATDRLVSFVDFAPTVLSLAGLEAPDHIQGFAFLGKHEAQPRDYVHTFRGRRGERYDIVRGVRSKRFLYLRNYSPQLPVMQFNAYSWTTIPSYRAWFAAWSEGGLKPAQARWFEAPKASEELYEVATDPDQVKNLAGNTEYDEVRRAHFQEMKEHLLTIRDSAFYPEGLTGRVWSTLQDEKSYPLTELWDLANLVSRGALEDLEFFRQATKSPQSCVRFWGVMGCVVLEERAKPAEPDLVDLLDDPEPLIRIQAARALAGMGVVQPAIPVLRQYLQERNDILKLRALLAVDEANLLESADEEWRALVQRASKGSGYAARVAEHLITRDRE